jgi:predicted enzyme related to lactoylglutathione lyase
MMTKMAEEPMPYWGFYFNVDEIDSAIARVSDRGGQVLNGPIQVPGGTWIANCLDPQGALFSLASANKAG